ncbi:MAG: KH domain-containing protein [Terriglobales bacterium]
MSTPIMPDPESTPAAEARTGDVRLLIEHVVKAIVEFPDEVIVDEVKRSGSNVELELQVSPKDIGKVIGKQGRTIRSLRTLAQAAGVVQNLRCNLELLEEDDLEDVDDEDAGDQQASDEQEVSAPRVNTRPQPGNTQPQPGNEAVGNTSIGNTSIGNTSGKAKPQDDADDDDNIGNRA